MPAARNGVAHSPKHPLRGDSRGSGPRVLPVKAHQERYTRGPDVDFPPVVRLDLVDLRRHVPASVHSAKTPRPISWRVQSRIIMDKKTRTSYTHYIKITGSSFNPRSELRERFYKEEKPAVEQAREFNTGGRSPFIHTGICSRETKKNKKIKRIDPAHVRTSGRKLLRSNNTPTPQQTHMEICHEKG